MSHTLTPWIVEQQIWLDKLGMEKHYATTEIRNKDGWLVGYWVDAEHSGWCPNADLIVRAVNAHDELIAALERLGREMDALGARLSHGRRRRHGGKVEYVGKHDAALALFGLAIETVKAIRRARGETGGEVPA